MLGNEIRPRGRSKIVNPKAFYHSSIISGEHKTVHSSKHEVDQILFGHVVPQVPTPTYSSHSNSVDSNFSTHYFPSGSSCIIFSRALISSLAASRYFSTFFMIFKAIVSSLRHQNEYMFNTRSNKTPYR